MSSLPEVTTTHTEKNKLFEQSTTYGTVLNEKLRMFVSNNDLGHILVCLLPDHDALSSTAAAALRTTGI